MRLSDYEAHMSSPDVKQKQILNSIIRQQFCQYQIRTLAILGIAGGNGLEYIDPIKIKIVYGIDINQEYLETCSKRFHNLHDHLVLLNLDLLDLSQKIPTVDLVIANLFIEFIGTDIFTKQIYESSPTYLSCVIQKDEEGDFISNSPYSNAFLGISRIHQNIDPEDLIQCMKNISYKLIASEQYALPNKKALIRLDFTKSRNS